MSTLFALWTISWRWWRNLLTPSHRLLPDAPALDRLARFRGWGGLVLLALPFFAGAERLTSVGDGAQRLDAWAQQPTFEALGAGDSLLIVALTVPLAWLVSALLIAVARPGYRWALVRSLWVVHRAIATVLVGLVAAAATPFVIFWVLQRDYLDGVDGDALFLAQLGTVALTVVALLGGVCVLVWFVVALVSGLPAIVPEFYRSVDAHPTMRPLMAIGYFTIAILLQVPGLPTPGLGGLIVVHTAEPAAPEPAQDWVWFAVTFGAAVLGLGLAVLELHLLRTRHGFGLRTPVDAAVAGADLTEVDDRVV
ncbi:hypothetical protein GCM10028784_28000 [Myceligenerans cantabricum]